MRQGTGVKSSLDDSRGSTAAVIGRRIFYVLGIRTPDNLFTNPIIADSPPYECPDLFVMELLFTIFLKQRRTMVLYTLIVS